jgi:Zn-dependent M28 family amino/carboxypeptidase
MPVPSLDRSPNAVTSRLAADLDVLLANGPRVAGSSSESAALTHAADTLGALSGVTVDYVDLPNGRHTRNVRSTFGGGGPHLLLGAHIDSIPGSPGADDNASGVIVLLELARRFVDQPPPMTVTVVAFGAEERLSGYSRDAHHYGSRALASRLDQLGALPDRMISVDMVGVDDRLLAVVYRGTDRSTAAMLASVGDAAGRALRIDERGDISDHEAFARRGVPSAFLWRPSNPDYHTPGDTTVDLDHLLEDLEVLEAFIAVMAEAGT